MATTIEVSRRRFGGLMMAGGIAALGLLAAGRALAIDPVFTKSGLAIRGYDPVAYFAESKPVKGKAEFTHKHMGAVWQFASAANRDAFAAEPDRFAPQYGGYCAWAVAQGYTASIDPDAWRIEGGKLYLNYSKSVQRRWERDIPGNNAKGDTNWPGIKAGG